MKMNNSFSTAAIVVGGLLVIMVGIAPTWTWATGWYKYRKTKCDCLEQDEVGCGCSTDMPCHAMPCHSLSTKVVALHECIAFFFPMALCGARASNIQSHFAKWCEKFDRIRHFVRHALPVLLVYLSHTEVACPLTGSLSGPSGLNRWYLNKPFGGCWCGVGE